MRAGLIAQETQQYTIQTNRKPPSTGGFLRAYTYFMNIIPVLVAAAVSFVIGALWYTVLFGKMWRRSLGISEDAKMTGMGKTLAIGFVIEVVRAYVMLMVVAAMGAYSFATGAEAGFWMWLGFTATIGLGQVIYENRAWKSFVISFGYHLVALIVVGGILATW